jgi:bile acid:Na+ symporter, BASS family
VIAVLEVVTRLSVLVFVVSSLLATGLGLTLREILAPLRAPRLILLSLGANFLLAPLVAYLLTLAIPLNASHAAGLLLLGAAAGAPFLPKLAELAGGNLGFAVALMILLVVGSTAFMPLALPLLIPGLRADPWSVAGPLVVLMLLPLGIGLAINARSAWLSARLQFILKPIVNISLLLLTALLIGLHFGALLGALGSGAVLAALLFVGITFALGYALGGPDVGNRRVLALGTSQRNIAAALVTATSSAADPEVVVMLLVVTLIGLVLILPAARSLRPARPDDRPVSAVEPERSVVPS